MEKSNKIILIFVIILTVIVLILCGYQLFKRQRGMQDAIKFKNEYVEYNGKVNSSGQTYPTVNISDDNNIKYLTNEDAVKMLSEGTGVIYFGFKTCPWCRSLITPLLEVAEEKNEIIYYLDISDIRSTFTVQNGELEETKKGTDSYYQILDLLAEYLDDYYLTDSEGNDYATHEKRLYAPTLVAIKEGKVTNFHVGTVDSQESGYNKLTNEQIMELKGIITKLIASKNSAICSQDKC